MAISAVTANANTYGGTSGVNFSMTSPTGTTTGDVLVCIVCQRQATEGVTNIADTATGLLTFTKLNFNSGGTTASTSTWYRVVQAGDPTAWTVTNAAKYEAGLMAYRGVDNTTPIDAQGTGNGGSSASGTYNAVTTVTNAAWYVGVMAGSTAAGPLSTLTSGSPTPTIRANAGNGGSNSTKEGAGLIDVAIASAGSSGTFVYTLSSNNIWGTYSFALRPAIIITDPFPVAYNYPDQLQQNAVYRM